MSDEWSPSMMHAALDTARSEMGEVFIHVKDPAVEEELLQSRYHLDRARAILRGVDPTVVEEVHVQ